MLNNKIIKNILDKYFNNKDFRYNYSLDYGITINLYNEKHDIKNNVIVENFEKALYDILEVLKRDKNILATEFEEEINSDVWYSGFNNVEDNELGEYQSNILHFVFSI